MTIKELGSLLGSYPLDLRVVVNGYEGGYDDLAPEQVSVIKIALGTGKYRWEGRHGETKSLTDATGVEEALVIRRVSN